MRHFLHAFAVIGLVLFTSLGVGAGESAGEFQSFAYPAEGGEDESRRQYFLHLPSTLKANAPLLFVLHGYRGDPRDYMGEMEMNRQAEEYGFAVCYPQGIKDDEGVAHWNAGLKISKVDDVAFLSQLALDLQKKHGLDPNRTFACGVSNGGYPPRRAECHKCADTREMRQSVRTTPVHPSHCFVRPERSVCTTRVR